jgi:hypothetical protein
VGFTILGVVVETGNREFPAPGGPGPGQSQEPPNLLSPPPCSQYALLLLDTAFVLGLQEETRPVPGQPAFQEQHSGWALPGARPPRTQCGPQAPRLPQTCLTALCPPELNIVLKIGRQPKHSVSKHLWGERFLA